MNKTQKKITILIVTAVIVISILFLFFKYIPIGERAKFIGTWKSDDNFFVVTFNPDGTGIFYGFLAPHNGSGTWQIDNGNITLTTWYGQQNLMDQSRYPYSFSNNFNTLQIAGENLIKQ